MPHKIPLDVISLVSVLRQAGPVVFLESQQDHHRESQKHLVAALPKRIITVRNHKTEIKDANGIRFLDGNPWEHLQTFYENSEHGVYGYLGYELKNYLEKVSTSYPDPMEFPDAWFMEPGFLLEIDLKTGDRKQLVGEFPDPNTPGSFSKGTLISLNSNVQKSVYLEKIARAQRYIFEGDCYEVNVSHRLDASYDGDPLALYLAMKQRGPVPFGAYLTFDDYHIVSSSPERFLKKDQHRLISEPIKGTVTKNAEHFNDRLEATKLLLSEKNKAENLMIVDLVRHDFSRVCHPGTVRVPRLFEIQEFDTLYQLVSRVEGDIMENQRVFDIISACFPMGSMTGAPKIRAMEIIDELEEYRRGVYSGTIGYITPQGDFDFSVVIRTALIRHKKLHYSVGGAITSDSNPEEEWAETWVKARALTESVPGTHLG